MAKSKKVEGNATVTERSSGYFGMAWETQVTYFDLEGVEYKWVSDVAAELELEKNQVVFLSAFARENNHLFRVKVIRESDV